MTESWVESRWCEGCKEEMPFTVQQGDDGSLLAACDKCDWMDPYPEDDLGED
jgi:hypothetical protein